MFYRRSDIEAAGGLRALAAEAAEDAASTKIMRASGPPRAAWSMRRSSSRSASAARGDVWDRQVRWARLRRDSFPALLLLEIASGAVLPLVAAAFIAFATGYSVVAALRRYSSRSGMARKCCWPPPPAGTSPCSIPLHAMLRDALLPVLWFEGWRERGFVWRGNAMSVDESRIASN